MSLIKLFIIYLFVSLFPFNIVNDVMIYYYDVYHLSIATKQKRNRLIIIVNAKRERTTCYVLKLFTKGFLTLICINNDANSKSSLQPFLKITLLKPVRRHVTYKKFHILTV